MAVVVAVYNINNNMEELFLNAEQCKHLQELGLDMSDAKFCIMNYKDQEKVVINSMEECIGCQDFENFIIPTYSLQEILEKLPDTINKDGKIYQLDLDLTGGYLFYWVEDNKKNLLLSRSNGMNLLDIAYEMLCWVIEEKYFKI